MSPRAAVGHSQSSHPCKHSRRTYMEHLQLPGDLWEVRKQNTHSPSECCQTSVKPNFVNLFSIGGSQNSDLPTLCPRLVAHSQQRLPRAHLWLWAPPGTGQPQQSCAQLLLLHSGLLHPRDTSSRAVRGGVLIADVPSYHTIRQSCSSTVLRPKMNSRAEHSRQTL